MHMYVQICCFCYAFVSALFVICRYRWQTADKNYTAQLLFLFILFRIKRTYDCRSRCHKHEPLPGYLSCRLVMELFLRYSPKTIDSRRVAVSYWLMYNLHVGSCFNRSSKHKNKNLIFKICIMQSKLPFDCKLSKTLMLFCTCCGIVEMHDLA